MRNYYEILNVREDATETQIRHAHRLKSMLHHPDRNGGSSASTQRQQEINEARDVLCDAERRAKLDACCRARENA